jgi:hypothetical protein
MAGEALMQAKIDLTREMNRRQGFLDGEDQKTLISFVLYGDPLASYDGFRVKGKAVHRTKDHMKVKVVPDQPEEDGASKLSGEALEQVKQIVAEYLPGADMGSMHLMRQPAHANGKNGSNGHAKASDSGGGHVVVMVKKQVMVYRQIHRHYMRVTLDETGKPVKMSISR